MFRASRVGLVHLALLLFAVALVGRAAQVQLWEGGDWASRARRQHVAAAEIPAPRGRILDAAGFALAESRELVTLEIAPREVRDRGALARALRTAGTPEAWVRRATDPGRKWVTLPGRYLPTDAAAAAAMRGVYPRPVVERLYAPSDGVRRLIGVARPDGTPVDGLELALDSLLRGRSGRTALLRDARGRRFESPTVAGVAAQPGATVVLTISYELQEIADRALDDAVSRMQAKGGDIVILDPHSGAVLAMASRRASERNRAATALTEPFEPGSTLKPLLAAALLSLGRARADEAINTYDGTYTLHGRTIRDEHPARSLTLSQVIGQSSNVGIVRFAERLTPGEQYEALRDFGFGTPTGAVYPSETGGRLRLPAQWSRQSPASLAMGYEIAVTPLQLALAYAAIANGGELLEPMFVKEVRTPDGDRVFEGERRVERRVVPEEVAATVRGMLVGVVSGGTGVEADLHTFSVAGKTGTARRASGGGYESGAYNASFVGLFPAKAPQYVILVKIDSPIGIFGGRTAAPVSRDVLQAALAARDAALDRGALARVQEAAADGIAADARERAEDLAAQEPEPEPALVALAAPRAARAGNVARRVPDVRGLPLRAAVRALHRAGFRVHLAVGPGGTTAPAAGSVATAGSTVRLFHAR
jgi:cell division protein FtsI (penicillin-binding protein 3)